MGGASLVPVTKNEKPFAFEAEAHAKAAWDEEPTGSKGVAAPLMDVDSGFPDLPAVFEKLSAGGQPTKVVEAQKTVPADSKAKKTIKKVCIKKGKKKGTKAKKSKGGGAKPAKDDDLEVISSEDDCELSILAAAMAFKPPAAETKKPKKAASKPKAKAQPKVQVSKAKAKAKDTKAAVPKKTVSKKKDANSAGPVSISEDENENKPHNRWFDAVKYGKCKVEFYSLKSYIRHFVDNKLTSIISSCCSKHHVVIEKMIPHVMKGENITKLKELRKDIMEEMEV